MTERARPIQPPAPVAVSQFEILSKQRPDRRTTDPNNHTPVGVRLAAVHRTRHLPAKENHRHRSGYVDNSLPRVLA